MINTVKDRIQTVWGGGRHVVILGAGASIASTLKNPEIGGRILPSMDNFIDVVGLADIIKKLPRRLRTKNFEELYAKLYVDKSESTTITEIESRVYSYFKDMQLPKEPTIYDYLVLSLRPKDLIATFNWDPFLFQAYDRNSHIAEPPHISFLHGNVAIGFSEKDNKCGPAGWHSKITGNYFKPTRLLYPVVQKNYTNNKFILTEWNRLKFWLNDRNTKLVTIFGYGAPATDVEAVKLLNQAWGTSDERSMEQFEIIDIRPRNVVRNQWNNFIHSHHYDYHNSYFNSSLAANPRRTSESYFQHILPLSYAEAFSASNPVPSDFKTLNELWVWHKSLVDAENEWKKN